jgi:hypothetical protein
MVPAGRHNRMALKQRPRSYPITPQQQKFANALDFCGIKKGISKADLQIKMKECLPKYFEENK